MEEEAERKWEALGTAEGRLVYQGWQMKLMNYMIAYDPTEKMKIQQIMLDKRREAEKEASRVTEETKTEEEKN